MVVVLKKKARTPSPTPENTGVHKIIELLTSIDAKHKSPQFPTIISIDSDGGIKVQGNNLEETKSTAMALAKRMHKRIITDRMFI